MKKDEKTAETGITLKKGKCYTHGDLNIFYPNSLKSYVETEGNKFLFVTINNGKYKNELHSDGVVHQPSDEKYLLKGSEKDEKYQGTHLMVRYHPKGDLEYEYIGDELYAIRWDNKRNKVFLK